LNRFDSVLTIRALPIPDLYAIPSGRTIGCSLSAAFRAQDN